MSNDAIPPEILNAINKDNINMTRKCKDCDKSFTPYKYAQCKTRCQDCQTEKNYSKKKEQYKKAIENLKKSKARILKKAQVQIDFNKSIRERDMKKYGTCISCGISMCEEKNKPNTCEAGHYIHAPKSKILKMHEMNVHGQCFTCNRMKNGNKEAYRQGLINRYGLYVVEELEALQRKEWAIYQK